MRETEARWISRQLAALTPDQVSPLVNLGSSTSEFRTIKQPHIDREIFAPLRKAGATVIHADLKEDPGVDIAGDLLDPAIQQRLKERRPRSALSSNLLEHVREPATIAQAMIAIVEPGGYLFVTVPHSYPYHADPIDTGFRPTPTELANLFPNTRVVSGEIVEDVTYGAELVAQGPRAVRKLLGALRPWGDAGRSQRDRLRWLFKPFSATCVVLQTAA